MFLLLKYSVYFLSINMELMGNGFLLWSDTIIKIKVNYFPFMAQNYSD